MLKGLREKAAQTALVLINGKEEIKDNVGGIFVGAQIITSAEDSVEFVKKLVASYQAKTDIPLLVASDFENGCGSMIKGLTTLPYLMGLGATNSEELAYNYGKVTALEALSVGANWSFSPVSDININSRNPLINVRGVSDDTGIAIPLLKNVVMGMQENGLAACAKHFPGDGVDWRDQHIVTTCNSLEFDKWKEFSGSVFSELIASGVYSIMAGHITLPDYQQEKFNEKYYLPATLSRELITKLLKTEMGFNGVVISDALDMGGFAGWYKTRERAEIECFKAGCDMLLWPSPKYIDNLVEAVENGYIVETRLNDAVNRIIEMKEKLGILNSPNIPHNLSISEKNLVAKTQKDTSEKSVTLLRDTNKVLPILPSVGKKVLLIPVTHYKPALNEALNLKKELEARGFEVAYHEELMSDDELKEFVEQADFNIYALFSRSFRPVGPIDFNSDEAMKIARCINYGKEKTIIVSFGSPYFINQYFERADIYINAYSMLEPSVKAFVRALVGEIPFNDFSPVKLN